MKSVHCLNGSGIDGNSPVRK